MKSAGLLAGLLFLGFAALQYNDADAWFWILIYLYNFVFAVLLFREKFLPLPSAIGALVFFGIAFYYAGLKGLSTLNLEEVREAYGLMICGVWQGILSWWGQKRASR